MGNAYIFADPSSQVANLEIPVISEFPSFAVLQLFMIATLLVAIVYRKKTNKSQRLQ